MLIYEKVFEIKAFTKTISPIILVLLNEYDFSFRASI